jgi:hypothetical protein
MTFQTNAQRTAAESEAAHSRWLVDQQAEHTRLTGTPTTRAELAGIAHAFRDAVARLPRNSASDAHILDSLVHQLAAAVEVVPIADITDSSRLWLSARSLHAIEGNA